MGIYRRKNKDGKYYGPYIVQYPVSIDPLTKKIKYSTVTAGFKLRAANAVQAQKLLEWEKKKHLGLEEQRAYTFRELAFWYKDLPQTKALKSARKVTRHCEVLVKHFGEMLVRDIKPYMVEAYQHKRLSQKNRWGRSYKPGSINREVEVMKRIFNLAIREDMVDRNPCFKVSKLSEKNARDRILSHKEFLALTAALPKHAAEIVRMEYYTGMRFGEIVGLTWDRVNLQEGYVTLLPEDTKNEEPRNVYLVPQAIEVLERANKVRSLRHQFVFTYLGNPVKSLRRSLKTSLDKAGIENFLFHDLRHTFNTNLRRAGVERTVIMKLTGHKTLSMFLRYSTVDEEDGKEAAATFSDLLARMHVSTAISTAESTKGLRVST